MKKFFLFTILFILWLIMVFSIHAKDVGGVVLENITWTKAESPIIVKQHVTVIEGVTLTIEPGVEVKFDQDKALLIDGVLIAIGTSEEKITFTSNGTQEPGYWGFISFSDTSADATFDPAGNWTGGSILQHTIIEYGGSAQPVIKISLSSPFIDNSLISQNSSTGISVTKGSLLISNCEIKSNSGAGISYGGDEDNILTIDNCIINDNRGKNGSGRDGRGIYSSGTIIIKDSTINGNHAVAGPYNPEFGGGIYTEGTLTIQNCNISSNSADRGGGIGVKGTLTVQNCNISSNFASTGGGISVKGTLAVQNCNISSNSLGMNAKKHVGGGIHVEGILIIQDSIISNNFGKTFGSGGGIHASGTATIRNCTINGNYCGRLGGHGGGIKASGEITIEENIFTDNSTFRIGGGVYAEGTVNITNNLFRKDKEPGGNSAAKGGAIYASGIVTLQGNTIIQNTVSTPFEGIVKLDELKTGSIIGGDSCGKANLIKDNAGDGVYIKGDAVFNYNDVYSNSGFSLVCGNVFGAADIDATNCYWGVDKEIVDKEAAVKASIWDGSDDPNLGIINYDSFLVESCIPDDTKPPAEITDLATTDPKAHSLVLTWTAPGDDGNEWQAELYDIRYSTSEINDGNWDDARKCTGEPIPKPAGEPEVFTVTGLSPETTYYFAMKTTDELYNWSGLSNVAPGTTLADEAPPAAVIDFAIFTVTDGSAILKWTAPGDDGDIGTAGEYDIRYSTSMITRANWDIATHCTEEPKPQPAGSEETFTVKHLSPLTTYYFALKTSDKAGKISDLSNVASGKTVAQTGDVNCDGKVRSNDALLVLQYAVGMIDEFPCDAMVSPSTVTVRDYILSLPSLAVKSGARIQVPIVINDATGLVAGGITLKFDRNFLKPIKATPDMALNGAFWKANLDLPG